MIEKEGKIMQIKIKAIIILLLFAVAIPGLALGEDESASGVESEQKSLWLIPNYRKNLRERPTLMGDWGGLRTEWANKGVIFALNNNTTFQSLLDGGKKEDEVLGGSLDYELQLDFQKMGLWPGAFARFYAETQYGNFINANTGAALAANTDGLFPLVDEDTTTLTGAYFIQFLSEWLALSFGKMDTLGGDNNEFAAGRGNDQFLNQNLVFNTVTLRTTPVSALGGGFLIVLPGEDSTFAFLVLDPDGTPDEANFDTAFESGVLYSSELRLGVNPFGLKGHQLLGGAFSTKDFTSLDQNRRLLVLNLLTTGSLGLAKSDSSWSFYYNFDQYVYAEKGDPEQGFGFFGRFGLADEDTSPIERFYSIGVGGKGVIPGRDKDTFGIGYFYVELSDQLPSVFDVVDDGQGVEFFYNIEVRPWLHVTPDYQIIDSGLKTNDTAHVVGLRVKIDL
jgi:porin